MAGLCWQTAKAWWKDFLQIRPEHANRSCPLLSLPLHSSPHIHAHAQTHAATQR